MQEGPTGVLVGSVLTLAMVGYSAGLTGRRDVLSAVILSSRLAQS